MFTKGKKGKLVFFLAMIIGSVVTWLIGYNSPTAEDLINLNNFKILTAKMSLIAGVCLGYVFYSAYKYTIRNVNLNDVRGIIAVKAFAIGAVLYLFLFVLFR